MSKTTARHRRTADSASRGPAASHRPTLTVDETAELLGISRGLAFQAVRRGELPSVRVGRRILVPRHRLEAWLETTKDTNA
jgi:excisionase family DNA binding protein